MAISQEEAVLDTPEDLDVVTRYTSTMVTKYHVSFTYTRLLCSLCSFITISRSFRASFLLHTSQKRSPSAQRRSRLSQQCWCRLSPYATLIILPNLITTTILVLRSILFRPLRTLDTVPISRAVSRDHLIISADPLHTIVACIRHHTTIRPKEYGATS